MTASPSVAVSKYFTVTGGKLASTAATPTTPTGDKKIAFSQLIDQGGSYKCTVHQYVQNTDTVGTVYIHGDKLRGEFNVKAQGMNMDTTLIVREGYTYTWTSMAPTMGFKVKVATSGGESNTTVTQNNGGTAGNYAWNADQIGDYTCDTWTVDETQFSLPTSVTFQAIN